MNSISKNVNWNELQDQIWKRILLFCGLKEFESVSKVSHLFHRILNHNFIFNVRFRNDMENMQTKMGYEVRKICKNEENPRSFKFNIGSKVFEVKITPEMALPIFKYMDNYFVGGD